MRLLIVIPAFNESEMIRSVIARIPQKIAKIGSITTLIVDDGSIDNTAKIARQQKIKVIRHLINRGLGATLATGFRFARSNNFDIMVTLDADGQHDPQDIKRLIKPLVKNQADVVIGSRLLQANGMPWKRKLVNFLSNILTWGLFSVWVSDSQSGFRLFNKRAIERIRLRSQHMEVSSEILKEIHRNHLRLQEVSIKSVYTLYSLRKGQKLTNAPNVIWQLLLNRFS